MKVRKRTPAPPPLMLFLGMPWSWQLSYEWWLWWVLFRSIISRLLKLSEVFSGLKFVEHLSLQQVGVQFAHFDASYINALWHLFFLFFLGLFFCAYQIKKSQAASNRWMIRNRNFHVLYHKMQETNPKDKQIINFFCQLAFSG